MFWVTIPILHIIRNQITYVICLLTVVIELLLRNEGLKLPTQKWNFTQNG